MPSQTLPEPSPSAGATNERFGRYELCVELATGGMATVYLATSTGPDGFFRTLAIKRIHPHLAKQQAFIDMFLDEARVAARIDHPNVCQVYDYGREGGTSFIAMEYLSGESVSLILAAIARGGARDWQSRLPAVAAFIAAEAAEGLHAAHELRDATGTLLHVVHRDVSPQNIVITYDGGVKVVDFGIASARNKVHETETGEIKGKFAYMAPEQMRGAAVDARADVWALGVVLWELLTATRLFRRETQAETVDAVQAFVIPTPSSVRAEVPASLDAIVMRALERDRERRYESARAFARDLAGAVRALGDAVGRQELADWMSALFPEGRARRTHMLELASQVRPTSELASQGRPTSDRPPPAAQPTRADRGQRHPPRARSRLVAGVAAATLVVGLGGAYALWRTTPSGEADAATQPTTTTATQDPARPPAPVEQAPPAPAQGPISGVEPAQTLPADRAPHARQPGPHAQRRRETTPSADPQPPPTPPPEVRRAADPGCLEIAAGVSFRLDGAAAIVEGPRRCYRVPEGTHRIEYVDRDTGAVVAERAVTVPGGGSVRIVAP